MAADQVTRQVYTFRDVKGHVARASFLVAYQSGTPADASALAALVRAAIMVVCGNNLYLLNGRGPDSFSNDPAAYPSPDAGERYIAAEDKIRFSYVCKPGTSTESGTIHKMELPAPLGANFDADDRTWSVAAQTAFANVFKSTSGTAYVSDNSLAPVVHVLGGRRIERRLQRKLTIYTKTPDLTSWEM